MKRWYVVQVYAGFEEAIKVDLDKQIKEDGLEHHFGDVLVPSAKMKSQFDTGHMCDRSVFCHSLCTLPEVLLHRFIHNLEPATGIEPVTSPLPRKCSTN